MKPLGGDVDFKYDHSIYWPALNQLAEQRRSAYYERWVKGGKRIGEFENYLKGGPSLSLSQVEHQLNSLSEKMDQLEVDSPPIHASAAPETILE